MRKIALAEPEVQALARREPGALATVADTQAALALVDPIVEPVLAAQAEAIGAINTQTAAAINAARAHVLAQIARGQHGGVLVRDGQPIKLHCPACDAAGPGQFCCPEHRELFERAAARDARLARAERTADYKGQERTALVRVEMANRLRDGAPGKAPLRVALAHYTAEVPRLAAEVDAAEGGPARSVGLVALHAAQDRRDVLRDAYHGLLLAEHDARLTALGGVLPDRFCASCGIALVAEPLNMEDLLAVHGDHAGRFCSPACLTGYHHVETAIARECAWCNRWVAAPGDSEMRHCSRPCLDVDFMAPPVDVDLWPSERWTRVTIMPAGYLALSPAPRRRAILDWAARVAAGAARVLAAPAPPGGELVQDAAALPVDAARALVAGLLVLYDQRVSGPRGPRIHRARFKVTEIISASGQAIDPGEARAMLAAQGLRIERSRGQLYVLDLTAARVAGLRARP